MRILGLGFGLAVVFGSTVGVGILRLPGTVAAQLGNSWLILAAWIAGGIYALLGAVSIAELAAMLPQAGGFYVYAKRAFGSAVGFTVGWETGSTTAPSWRSARSPLRNIFLH
jgi:basic amino acid/polyamine antiporter, APA family